MISVSVRFLTGRYHATPWGHHVNEGTPEWPPSPWRFLRALVATWKRTMPDVPDEQMAPILAVLTGAPSMQVPPATPAHTRHYMPWFKKGPEDRTLVFDTFAAVLPQDAVRISWPLAELDAAQRQLLGRVVSNLPYLGRAESWCAATLDGPETVVSPNCAPITEASAPPADMEVVPILVAEAGEPQAVLEALLVETGELRGRRRLLTPPGGRFVSYGRPKHLLGNLPPAAPTAVPRQPVHVLRFALEARPLPSLLRTLAVGESARQGMLGRYARLHPDSPAPATLSGRDSGGPLHSAHTHAFYLPSDEDLDGRIDHLTVFASGGFAPEEQEALASLGRLFVQGEEVARLLLLGAAGLDPEVPGLEAATEWVSITPFVLRRHPKRDRHGTPRQNSHGEQQDGPEDELRREWARRRSLNPALPNLVAVRRIDRCPLRGGRTVHWLDFARDQRRSEERSTGRATGFALTFDAPVRGPIALGYGCHVGLGQFRPKSPADDQ